MAKQTGRSGTTAADEDAVRGYVQAWLDSGDIERAEAYAAKGRRFAAVDTAALKDAFARDFRRWLAAFSDRTARQDYEDCWAELSLRGEEPPFDLVKPEMELFRQGMVRMMENDPAWRADLAERASREILAFVQAMERTKGRAH